MIADLYIKLSEISFTLSHRDATLQNVVLTHINVLVGVEYSLFPVCVFFVWTCTQKNRSSKITEWGVEPSNKSMNSIVVEHLQLVLTREFNIFFFAVY